MSYLPAVIVLSTLVWLGHNALRLGPDVQRTRVITAPHNFFMLNGTVARVDPAGRAATVEVKGFDINGSSLNPPWELVEVSVPGERYVVSDRGCANHELLVNDVLYSFDFESQRLVVTPGLGVTIGFSVDRSVGTSLGEDFGDPPR